MLRKLLPVHLLLSIALGQTTFTEHAISTSADRARSVYATDVDGDGDMDVLSASGDDKIAWYENDGSESFTEHVISRKAKGAFSVHAADVDGDGDMDVLSASRDDDKIAWYENDGSESFTEHAISTSANGAESVYKADVDGDGDMDVLSASSGDDKIAWYENDGSESFTEHAISTSANGAKSVYAVDVDADGDMDVLSASRDDDKIAWYENDGSESFTEHAISTSADGARSVYATDVDGDGDMDILTASYSDDKIAWYENDGSESFTEHVISTSADGAKSVYAVDVDGDGDMDVLSASIYDDKIAWYEQDGVYPTYVPDDNFEQALIDLGYDDVIDDYVLTENISGITSLDVSDKEISDLTGIEGFTTLTILSCHYNTLTALDVSANPALTTLYCAGNQLTALDVSANPALTVLSCYGNDLTTLDVSANPALTSLSCSDNQLTNLDVNNNTGLTTLTCNRNQLTNLGVSNNTLLEHFSTQNNTITSLDVSSNTALIEFRCDVNQLTYLNMRNGVTDQLTTFNATNNNSLDCIEVSAEDVDYATTNWTSDNGNIDDGVIFGGSCSPPDIVNIQLDDDPGDGEELDITVEISDENDIDVVTLYYQQGCSEYTSVAMSGSVGSYTGTIPGSAVTMNGLLYFIVARNTLGFSSTSDIFCIEVRFNSGSLTTGSLTSSAYPRGLPMDKWRLLSIPAVLDDSGVSQVIGDELGTQDDNVWRLFEYNEGTGSFNDNPGQFTPGDSYWLYQRVGNNLSLSAPAGQTGNMCGTDLTIKPGWNLIGSPYSFSLPLVLDPVQFYGPITYGVEAEEWSNVVSEMDPWNGYAVYNRTSNDLNISLDPAGCDTVPLARTLDEEEGWLMTLQARGNDYQDSFNMIGALSGAHDQLDWHDNPEIRAPERFVSLFFKIPDEEQEHLFTSDIRALDGKLKIWDTRIRSTAMESGVTLSWHRDQTLPAGLSVQLLDLNTRTVVDMVLSDHLVLGHLDSHYDRQLKIISGDPAAVSLAVDDILSQVPEELSIQGNYPNPFNPVTTIRFGLPEPRRVSLTIVNMLGQEVVDLLNGWKGIGHHEIRWQSLDNQGVPVASGVYFAVLRDGISIDVRKMILLK